MLHYSLTGETPPTFTSYSDTRYIECLDICSTKKLKSSQLTLKLNSGLTINSCFLRYPTGLEIRESDTRKILENSKKKPTCTLPEPPLPQPTSPPTAAKPTRLPHQIQLVSIAVNPHTNNRCACFSLVFNRNANFNVTNWQKRSSPW